MKDTGLAGAAGLSGLAGFADSMKHYFPREVSCGGALSGKPAGQRLVTI